MELLFVFIIGAIIGIIARYVTPRRDRYGVTLVPALGATVASATWVILTWVGFAWDGGLIWWLSLVSPAVLCLVVALRVGARREQHDERRFNELANS